MCTYNLKKKGESQSERERLARIKAREMITVSASDKDFNLCGSQIRVFTYAFQKKKATVCKTCREWNLSRPDF